MTREAMLWTLMLGALAGAPVSTGAGPEPAAGVLLYAAPHMGDANFGQTVVLLVHYSEEGAQGVVINSPTQIAAREALPDVEGIERLQVPVYYGGPVQPERVMALIREPGAVDGAIRVFEDVHFTARRQTLAAALGGSRPTQRVRVFVGNAGWAPGQLDYEIARGDWFLEKADVRAVFSERPEELWERVYRLQQRIQALRLAPGRLRAALDHLPRAGSK